ncbi:MAG: 16S rRNA processing protein RimM [Fretibacterium sp.]|nr:16S rRNA processing protein RimM [Fretibacterium sp.]
MSISSRSEENSPTASPSGEKILIGRVSSAHGLHGEINVVPLTDFPERFRAMDSISLYRGGRFLRTLRLEGVRRKAGGDTLTLRTELEGRDEAEACVGADILIGPDERVELPPGHFWVDDLVGLTVEDMEGHPLGVVSNLIPAGANELYEVRDPAGALHYIPAVEEFVREIDLENGRLQVSLIEGLWDIPGGGA